MRRASGNSQVTHTELAAGVVEAVVGSREGSTLNGLDSPPHGEEGGGDDGEAEQNHDEHAVAGLGLELGAARTEADGEREDEREDQEDNGAAEGAADQRASLCSRGKLMSLE